MRPFTTLDSKVVTLAIDDVDTDQIIPARFLKITDKAGLGSNLFYDWRYLEDGGDNPEFVLNTESALGSQILLAGDNFGCGSSREHAPWALTGWGFRAVISTSFADIFRNNSLKNGLLLIELSADQHASLLEQCQADPAMRVQINLAAQALSTRPSAVEDQASNWSFDIDAFSKRCLLEGLDQLGYLASFGSEIDTFEKENDR